jgi:hypothetical protein
MSGDVWQLRSRMDRLEAVMFGPTEDESGGLRAQVASLAVSVDKKITIIESKMDQMMFWFRLGAFGILIFLALFGPPQIQEIIRMFKGKV